MRTWVCLGGGPSAREWYDGAREGADAVATTNAGILIEPSPTFYYLNDMVAIERHLGQAIDARARGTKLVMMNKASHRRHGADVWLPFDSQSGDFKPGQYRYHPLSGTMLVQIAVNSGAEEVRLVGFEGYAEADGERLQSKTEGQAQMLASIAAACPDVRFVWYGRPNYAAVGEVIESQGVGHGDRYVRLG